MITQAFLSLILAPLTWLMGHLPTFTFPAWFSGTSPCVSTLTVACYGHDYVGQNLRMWDAWVPAQLLVDCMGIVIAAVAIMASIKLLRTMVSMFTGGGGSVS